jgi:ubiquinone/menaquinone biosynthesis C-methylase UbiE
VSYWSLARRVPETSAVEPRALTWLYDVIAHVPLVRTVHRRFVAGALAQGVERGCGLDLGTGPGYVAAEIARRRPGLHMLGLDLAAHMVERAQRRTRRQTRRHAPCAALDGRGLWTHADGHHLPFADGSFDLVVSSFALHHWEDPVSVFDEIARVLRRPQTGGASPGGRYYIADVCREASVLQRSLAYASIPAISLAFGSYLGYGGYYESVRASYTRDEILALLARSALPPGEVKLDSTWLVPILTIASKVGSPTEETWG